MVAARPDRGGGKSRNAAAAVNTLETLSYKLKSGRKLEAKDDSASRYSAIDEEGKSSAKRSSPGLAKGGRPKHGDYQSSNFQ